MEGSSAFAFGKAGFSLSIFCPQVRQVLIMIFKTFSIKKNKVHVGRCKK